MKKLFLVLAGFFIFSPIALNAATADGATLSSLSASEYAVPKYLYIPSINLRSPVEGVGIDEKGRMDVPPAKTNKVGWYKYGAAPGNPGTAVLDAHNTAAFRALDKVPVGSEVYVIDSLGQWQKFVVKKAKVYEAKTTDPAILFEPTNRERRQLNLITCAGKPLGNGEATHRLIVSGELAT